MCFVKLCRTSNTSKTQKFINSIGKFRARKISILTLFLCNLSFGTEECVFHQNLETFIFTYAPPALGAVSPPPTFGPFKGKLVCGPLHFFNATTPLFDMTLTQLAFMNLSS